MARPPRNPPSHGFLLAPGLWRPRPSAVRPSTSPLITLLLIPRHRPLFSRKSLDHTGIVPPVTLGASALFLRKGADTSKAWEIKKRLQESQSLRTCAQTSAPQGSGFPDWKLSPRPGCSRPYQPLCSRCLISPVCFVRPGLVLCFMSPAQKLSGFHTWLSTACYLPWLFIPHVKQRSATFS